MPSVKLLPRSFASKDRAAKATKPVKRSFRDSIRHQQIVEKLTAPAVDAGDSPTLLSAIITLVVGREQRMFAAHEDVLSVSPYFAARCKDNFFSNSTRRIDLPDEEAEVLSCVLEYLYKGDYTPQLVQDKRHQTWVLENRTDDAYGSRANAASCSSYRGGGPVQATVYHSGLGDVILRDTAVYCAADRYGLDELKRLALRKQGLHSGIEVATILRSARFAYENTPDSDSRLRAHYLALIIRSRRTFKRSGTMQHEMEKGGKLFFDLFVAMCNHIDDIVEVGNNRSPRTI